jgi:tRNA threonylcarbamoyl adenosine modification protein YeaZ/ribosomal-protein-alanine acetyltransferase
MVMILLALDTSLASCSVCVYDAAHGKILSEACELMERGHAEALPPMVASAMVASGKTFADLNRIAVTTGPGTFTGIRIGLSFARSLGLALNIKVLGIDSLTATQVAVIQSEFPVLVVHKAGLSGLIYANSSKNIELLKSVELPTGPALIIGTAAAELVSASGRSDLHLAPLYDLPSASGFAAYAAVQPEPDAMPVPLYLREADAKPQGSLLRGLPDLQILVADTMAIPTLANLHAVCFEEPWDQAAFTNLMSSAGVGALLAQSIEGAVGLLLYRAVAGEAEILTIGVDPNLRRRGAGKALLDGLLALKIPQVFLEVASRNEDAINLYTKAGFKQVGLRKAYYAKSGDDALILRWEV